MLRHPYCISTDIPEGPPFSRTEPLCLAALRREPSLADVDLSRLVSSRLRGQLRRSSSSGFDEPFSLQTPALHIPEHLWHPHAFRLASPHLRIPSAGCKALLDTWADACRRIRAAIHQPYLPWWGKLNRHRRVRELPVARGGID
jgi:hypothetical protein